MTGKIQLIAVAALILTANAARGDSLIPGGGASEASRRNGEAIVARARRRDEAANRLVGLFQPTSPDQVFVSHQNDLWTDSTLSAATFLPGDLVTGFPRLQPIAPPFQGLRTPPRIDDWDQPVVRLASHGVELSDDTMLEPAAIQRLAPSDGEELPPPVPGEYDWVADEVGSGVTMGEIEVISDVLNPDGIVEGPDEILLPDLPMRHRTALAARLGGWSVDSKGSPVKVGEFQSLDSSVFFDVEGLYTNGLRTWDFYGSILDNDAPQAGLRFYGPTHKARIDFQGYLRRLDRDPFIDYVDFDQQPDRPLPGPPGNFRDMKEDLTVGDDFAIRVQQLNTSFRGRLTDHLNWRLNLWGMRKHGERQASAMAHCFTAQNATDINGNPVTGVACHVFSQSQRIDWLTAEIEPALEAKYGPVTVEYSRTMRTLTTDDQLVTRPYDNLGLNGDLPYAIVPENYTEIDRLKIGVAFPDQRDGYARLYSGRTQNEFRDTDRDFRGFDLRLTDRSIPGVTMAGYARNYVQKGEFPSVLLPLEDPTGIRTPINYDRTTAGFEAGWRPFYDEWSLRSRLRFSSGYEYQELERENAVFGERAVVADNSFTKTNLVFFRTSMNWTPTVQSYVRYRVSFIDDPLYAAPIGNTTTNSSLPTQVHGLQFGNTWAPSHHFFLHGLFGLNNGWNSSDFASFQSDNYDLVFTAWYAPTCRWTVSAGMAFFANWIDQDITLGSKTNPLTLPWEYGGRSDVMNLGTTYAWTDRMTISGNVDFVRGRNAFDPLEPWPDLWEYSDVNVETTRFGVGLDYELTDQSSLYFRYQLFDYDDKSDQLDGGTAEMYLFGVNAYF